jgi:hypothetical protein
MLAFTQFLVAKHPVFIWKYYFFYSEEINVFISRYALNLNFIIYFTFVRGFVSFRTKRDENTTEDEEDGQESVM